MKRLYSLLILLLAFVGTNTAWADGTTAVTDESSLSNSTIYYLQSPRGFLIAADGATYLTVSLIKNGTSQSWNSTDDSYFDTLNDKDDTYQFLIIKSDYTSNYYIYSIGEEKFIYWNGSSYSYSGSSSDHGNMILGDASNATVFTIDCDAYSSYGKYTTSIKSGTKHLQISMWLPNLADNSNVDLGCSWAIMSTGTESTELATTAKTAIEEYEMSVAKAALNTAISNASSTVTGVAEGDGYGYYTETTDGVISALASAYTTATTAYNSTTSTYQEIVSATSTLTSALSTATSNITLNTPAAGSFIKIKASAKSIEQNSNRASKPYMLSSNTTLSHTDSSGNTVTEERASFGAEASDGTDIFYFDGTHLLAYATGYYAIKNSYSSGFLGYNGVTEGASFAFTAPGEAEAGALNCKFAGSRYLFANVSGYTDAGNSNNYYGYNFEIQEVTSIPVTISSNTNIGGYTTFYAPVGVRCTDENVTIYSSTITDKDENGDRYLKITAVDSKEIPGGTAVLLKGTAGSTVNFTVDTSISDPLTSALKGQENTINTSDVTNPLTLQYPSTATQLGFYLYTGSTLKGFKAYLTLPDGESVRGFIFDDGGTTGIDAVETTTTDNSAIYDLQGRRINKVTRGLYIKGGKKVLVK